MTAEDFFTDDILTIEMPFRRRRLATISGEEVEPMRVTLHIGQFTVTVIVKRNNRHSAK